MNKNDETSGPDPLNRDPITGEPGSHPVGTGIGSAGGAAAGAAAGAALGGPIGAAVGGVVGAVAGAAAGHTAGEEVNPTVEAAYWRDAFYQRPYSRSGRPYSDYEPAYRYGWESATEPNHEGRTFDSMEKDLEARWGTGKGQGTQKWHEIKDAARDAFERVRTRRNEQQG